MTFSWKTVLPAAGLLAAASVAAQAADTTIRLSTYVNESDVRYDGFVHFANLVNEKTGGTVEVQI